jgi:hypothetical protein
MIITKRRRQERIPLAKALRNTNDTIPTTINQDRKAGRGDTTKHLIPPFRTKTKTPQEIEEKLPVDMVVGFFQVQLTNNSKNSRFQPIVQTLISFKNWV